MCRTADDLLLDHTPKDATFSSEEQSWVAVLRVELHVHCATNQEGCGMRALPLAVGADGISKPKYDDPLTGLVLLTPLYVSQPG